MVIFTGICGVFGSLLHYMLPPRKRTSQQEEPQQIVEDDNGNSSSPLKKHRISTSTAANSSSSSSSVAAAAGLPIMALGDSNHTDIDEDLHSRQLAVYGRETMRRLFASNILVSGMQGLGVEIGRDFSCFLSSSDFSCLWMLF